MTILITGCAGFIGFHTCKKLLENNNKIVGIDSLNNYYDVRLKRTRLKILYNQKKFTFIKNNLQNQDELKNIITRFKIKKIIHLAAQAGVRDSISSPKKYFDNNVISFFNLLECHRKFKFESFVFASSSSVYGRTKKMTEDSQTSPLQFYAATKKSNEDFAKIYSEIYKLSFVGLRFFTVYGSYGRPDMSYFKFSDLLRKDKNIQIYNHGKHTRDFTHVEDVVECIKLSLNWCKKNKKKFEIFNVGNGNKVPIMTLITLLENNFNKIFKKKFVNKQVGDMENTLSNLKKSKSKLLYKPKIKIKDGIEDFCSWYKKFYKFK